MCQTCEASFDVTDAQLSFYKTLFIPTPALCAECRRLRRLIYLPASFNKNSWAGHCGLCHREVYRPYPPQAFSPPVYCVACWSGGGWQSMDYGKFYDSTQPFFLQLGALLGQVPVSDKALLLPNPTAKNITRPSTELEWCGELEWSCECVAVAGPGVQIRFCLDLAGECADMEYSVRCQSCRHCFGCVGLHKKQYCILNKQYTPEIYASLIEQIREAMQTPYKIGENMSGHPRAMTFSYGDFLPPHFSFLGYSQSAAYELQPLLPEQAAGRGFGWVKM